MELISQLLRAGALVHTDKVRHAAKNSRGDTDIWMVVYICIIYCARVMLSGVYILVCAHTDIVNLNN